MTERILEALLGLFLVTVIMTGFAALHGINDGRVENAVTSIVMNKGGAK